MINKLQELLRCEQKELQAGFKKASFEGYGTPQEVADRREELMSSFLGKYFPFPFRVAKGNIIDSYGKNSCSIDCVILNPAHPYTIDNKNNKASVLLADGVDFAIEVKGDLTTQLEIERALKQIKSVKDLKRVKNNHFLDENDNYWKRIPCVIYADKIPKNRSDFINNILRYYVTNKISRPFQFDMIISPGEIIFNSCKELPSFWGRRNFYFLKSEDDTLAAMLYLLSCFPLSGIRGSKEILTDYLRNILDGMGVESLHKLSELLINLDMDIIENEEKV